MYSLRKLEQFVQLLHAVQHVKRVSRRPDEKQMTNTAEHTFEVVMVCWYIMAVHNLSLDQEKVLKYALAHDVIEAYAGDTYIYDAEAQKTKAEREEKALRKIEKEFVEFGDLTETIREYTQHSTKEAKFVYAVDKLIDPLNASMEKTQSIWKEFDVSLNDLLDYKTKKIAESADVLPYWDLLVEKLNEERDFFFKK